MISMNNSRGLTLVELMIVIAVLSILTAVAYPMYTQQVQKSRRAEARSMAMKLAFAEEQYRSLRGNYLNVSDLSDISNLGLDDDEWNTASGQGLFHYYDFAVTNANATQFRISITPRGTQTADSTKCSAFRLDQLLNKTATGTLGNDCW